ncbi:MAG TPA: cardiolipin synthase [Spirochaetota bacterium]|nr:cardiolipin synthase [Spirochaetota bacterium]
MADKKKAGSRLERKLQKKKRPPRSEPRFSMSYSQITRKIKNRFFLPHFLRDIKSYGLGEFSDGNKLTLFTNGDTSFNSFFKSIQNARLSINLETYIFNSDDLGWKMARLLVEKAQDGIEVNVIYDAIGCIATSPALFSYMRKGGVELVKFHPLIPWRKVWNISFRDHRKILVVDGKTAFVGGMNIGLEYAGKKLKGHNWRDTHLEIEGPAVRMIEFFFMENWHRQGGAMINFSKHFPPVKEKGNTLVMTLSSMSRKGIKPIQLAYLTAIKHAHESIFITNAYFIPDRKIYRALVNASNRGVDVRLILPGKNDLPFVQYASRYLYKRYLKHNINVFEYQENILHAKTAVIDGIWSTVGSSNLDRRSFKKNREINAIVLDNEFGKEMVNTFYDDLKKSHELLLENWEKRSLLQFFLEWLAYRFRNLM